MAVLATLLAWPPGAAAQTAETSDCPSACASARAKIALLVQEFARDSEFYTSTAFNEADTRRQFIDRFFEALGWDVTNQARAHLYDQDVIPETRLRTGRVMRYADYGFRLDARATFYVEAKAANQNIDKPKHVFQAKRYAWSSARAELAVLTDFETLRVFDARILPRVEQPKAGELEQFRMDYTEYVENFPRLWRTFAKPLVADGGIRKVLNEADPSLERIEVDQAFLADLDRFRLALGQDLYAANPHLGPEQLNEATHHILNQIVFSRVLEDRDIEPTGRLREAIDIWRTRGAEGRLFDYLKAEFGRLERRYNGVMFGAHFSDSLEVPDRTLAKIVDALYPPTSPYAFDVIPVDVLGRAYEGYLGKRLEIDNGTVTLAANPEVRKAGGVFYTPEWVIDYILERTLTPKLRQAGERPRGLAERGGERPCSSRAKTLWTQNDWRFPEPSRRKLFDAMMCQNFVLEDVAKISAGIRTGADKVFVVEKLDEKDGETLIRSKATGATHWIESTYLRPILLGRDVRRYKPLTAKRWLVFPYYGGENPVLISKNDLASGGPQTLAYLKAAWRALGKPGKINQPWYGFDRLSYIDNPNFTSEVKLIAGWAPGKPQFTLDRHQFFSKDSVGAVLAMKNKDASPFWFLGLLNSVAFQTFLEATTGELWNGFLIRVSNLGKFPIPPLDDTTRPLFKEIGTAAQELLRLHALKRPNQAEIDRLESRIDTLSYALYGVTPETRVSVAGESEAAVSPAKPLTDLMKLRILDPACGAGAFTVQMAGRILRAATDYYAAHPDRITGRNTEFPDAYQLFDGSYKLSAPKKAELIEKTVFCVDVDPQAVEITKMWLYILMLEGEGSPIVKQERSYKIPNRIWPTRAYDFELPDLAGNVVNGNSLVASDFSDDPAERKRVRAFDWDAGDSKIAGIIRSGGFDVVGGNPPYISLLDAKKFIPKQQRYIRDTYRSMAKGLPDISYAFMEKGISLLKDDGALGFITTNGYIWNESGAGLRKVISECECLSELIDFGVTKIFEDAGPAISVIILQKGKRSTFRHARVLIADNPALANNTVQAMPDLAFQNFPLSYLKQDGRAFPQPQDIAVFEAMERQPLRLKDFAAPVTGFVASADGRINFMGAGSANDGQVPIEALLGVLNSRVSKIYLRTLSPNGWADAAGSTSAIERFPIIPATPDTLPIYSAITEKAREIFALNTKPNSDWAERNKLETNIDALVRQLYGIK